MDVQKVNYKALGGQFEGQVPWRVVFVELDKDRIKQVARHWDSELCFATRGTRRIPGSCQWVPKESDGELRGSEVAISINRQMMFFFSLHSY